MSRTPHREATRELREALMALGRRYDAFGWVFGTGGNFSARTEPGFLVTASGRHKGMLNSDDFVEIDAFGNIIAGPEGARPSAEASIHAAIYRHHPDAGVALHVHTPAGVLTRPDLAARGDSPAIGAVLFEDLEMVKAWGIEGFATPVAMPVFENHADVGRIARDIAHHHAIGRDGGPVEPPALLIRTHGVTAWGRDAFEANRNLETAEFLCRVRLAARGIGTL
jgi:methylthioribulose-1-phosphate dehydratase